MRHYCVCLTFSEDVAMEEALKEDDGDDAEQELTLVRCSKLYAPKSLVLVSRLDYFETFRASISPTYFDIIITSLRVLMGLFGQYL